MSFRGLMNLILVIGMTAAFAAILGVWGPSTEPGWPAEIESREYRRDMQAAQFCRATIGESTYQWAEGGELVCIPRGYIKR